MAVLALALGISASGYSQNNNYNNENENDNGNYNNDNSNAGYEDEGYENESVEPKGNDQSQANSNNEYSENGNNYDNNNYENENSGTSTATMDIPDDLRHPRAANRWRTRELILTAENLPIQIKLDECRKELLALASRAINHMQMLESRNIMVQSISKRSEMYHWCFYYTMMRVDDELDANGLGMTYGELYKFFVDEMKAMWILARALDAAMDSHKYFGYLRRRYIENSLERFGRNVEVLTSPLGDDGHVMPYQPAKPAGAYKPTN